MGTMTIELFTDKMPITAGNFIKLAKDGFYDGLTFHRVIADFMVHGVVNAKTQQAKLAASK